MKITPSVQILPQPTLEDRIKTFLDNQLGMCVNTKEHYLESFKTDLTYRMHSEGLTDQNLLLGLELNNYLRQINNPTDSSIKLQSVNYSLGG